MVSRVTGWKTFLRISLRSPREIGVWSHSPLATSTMDTQEGTAMFSNLEVSNPLTLRALLNHTRPMCGLSFHVIRHGCHPVSTESTFLHSNLSPDTRPVPAPVFSAAFLLSITLFILSTFANLIHAYSQFELES